MSAASSPYAVPLAELDAVRVREARQVTEQAEPRTRHLPGDPVLWGLALGAAAGGGAAAGCGADGDC